MYTNSPPLIVKGYYLVLLHYTYQGVKNTDSLSIVLRIFYTLQIEVISVPNEPVKLQVVYIIFNENTLTGLLSFRRLTRTLAYTNHGLLLRGIMRPGNIIHLASRENGDYALAPKIEYHYFGEPIDTHVNRNLDKHAADNSTEHAGN